MNGTTYDEGNTSGIELIVGGAANGCDSTVSINLIFNIVSLPGSVGFTGCQGDGQSITVNGTVYDEANPSGTEVIIGGAANGCDTTININLIFNVCVCPPELHTELYVGCEGDGYSITINGTTYNELNPAGTETFIAGASTGCDSIVTIDLTFNVHSSHTELYSGCSGDGYSVNVNGTTYDESNPNGVEVFLNGASNGCDSTVTVNLIYLLNSTGAFSYSGCAGDGFSIDVNGTTYDEGNTSGTELIIGGAANGCDSTVTVSLTYLPNVNGSYSYTGCQGDGFSIDVNGTTYDEANTSGTEFIIGGASNGCDSTVTVSLTYLPNVSGSYSYTGCQGDGFSIDVNGTTYDEGNTSGTELIVGGASNGCDSMVTVSLTYLPNVSGSYSYTGCQGDGFSIDVNGTTYDEGNTSGTELILGGASNGCDSMVTVSLTYLPNVSGSYSYTGCQGDGFSIDVNGTTYDEGNTSGTELIVGGASNGCDSTVTINLVFDVCTCPPELYTETYTGCAGDGYSIIVNGTQYNEGNPNGTETFIGGAFSGCDSIVTISLTYLPNSTGAFSYSGCEGDGFSIDVNGTTYDEGNTSGTELIIGGAVNGCDSTVTVSLTYLPNSTGAFSYSGCQGDGFSIDVNGTTYDEGNTSGTELIIGGAANGCDSTVTVSLTYLPNSTGAFSYSGCQGDGFSIDVNGTTYDEGNTSGTELIIGGAANGCDSIVTVSLTYLPNSTGAFSYSGCQGDGYSIDVNGTTYDEGNTSGTELIVGGRGKWLRFYSNSQFDLSAKCYRIL